LFLLDNERRNENISTGAIVGIAVGVAAAVVILVIVVYCIRKQLSKRRHSRQVETQGTGMLGSSSPNNNITAFILETR
jgi:cell division protein FtsN